MSMSTRCGPEPRGTPDAFLRRTMQSSGGVPALLSALVVAVGGAAAYGVYLASGPILAAILFALALLAAWAVALSIKVALAWERAVVLRLGRFHGLRGPGLFAIIPVVDTVPYWIDVRVITSSLKAEQTLSRDTVPVDVDAVLFWKVLDPERAALAVASYNDAVSWAAQTALRDVIGKTLLAEMLEGREQIGGVLQRIIDARTEPWGISVVAVEVRDVRIPPSLQDAMSMQAQAERERQARVILGDSERQVAQSFLEASKTYAADPVAMHLRAMNMLYEGLKQNATIVVLPSSALETMQLGGVSAAVAATMAVGGNGAARGR
jgi:regulator of protease activity HflC (stomatin/prohibitin superfamily)